LKGGKRGVGYEGANEKGLMSFIRHPGKENGISGGIAKKEAVGFLT